MWNEPHDTLAILVYSVQIKTLQQCLYALRLGVDLAFSTRLMKPCLHLLSPKCENSTIDAAEEAVPGAQEEILTGHIKATDEQIVALASIPKKERPAILEELKKKKSDRDDTILERLKPSKPPPKPKPAPQKKKPTATENNTASQAEQPETSVQAPITESPPEEEIEPTSNAPPSFLQSIQGHKRHLSEEDKARLKASVDARYKDKAAATGSIMLCELQGATEDFIFRWNVVFQEHPEVLIDKVCQKKLSELMDRMMSYLKTVKEEKL